MGCCVFTSELECTARHKPKHAVHFSINSWPMQKPNTYLFENLFCYQGAKQCVFHAMLMHSFTMPDRVKAGPCGAMVDCLTFQQDRTLHLKKLASETKWMIVQEWSYISKEDPNGIADNLTVKKNLCLFKAFVLLNYKAECKMVVSLCLDLANKECLS